MVQLIQDLKWQVYQGGAPGTLVAIINLDSAVDFDWTVPTVGKYNIDDIAANQVVVFNNNNNGTVILKQGPITFPIDPFTRDTLNVTGSAGTGLGVHFEVGTIQLQFFKGTPPYNPTQINYSAATAAVVKTFTSIALPLPANGAQVTVPHTLGQMPFDFNFYLVCVTADQGWVPGDVVKYIQTAQANAGIALQASDTFVRAQMAFSGITLPMPAFGGATGTIVNANWQFYINAWV